MNPADSVSDAATPLRLSHWPDLNALGTLFVLSCRQQLRGPRLLGVSLLLALPAILAALINLTSRVTPPAENVEFALLLNLLPHALAPLAALLYAGGVIRDEVEEQTLTYLLLRPLSRGAMYVVKLLAALLATSLLIALFTAVAMAVIHFTTPRPADPGLVDRTLKMVAILALAEASYCGLFGLLGLLLRRSLVVGVAYIVLFEGVLASFDTLARRLTVMYHFRVLSLRWLEPAGASAANWAIPLDTAPRTQACVWTLLGIGLALTLAGAVIFATREFRMKTPEGA